MKSPNGLVNFLSTLVLVAALWLVLQQPTNAQSIFTNVPIAGLPVVGSVAWGDYDNDGRLDFLLAGSGVTQLWRNMGGGFTNMTASVVPGLPGVQLGSVAWGDYDNDGRLDFLLTGISNDGLVSQLWRNTGNGFANVTASNAPGLPNVASSSVAWADFDNDGRLDFLITGSYVSQLWQNNGGGNFSNVTATAAPGLPGVQAGSVAWGDYDNDGRLDFLLTGFISYNTTVSQLWRNTGNGFTNVTPASHRVCRQTQPARWRGAIMTTMGGLISC